MGKVGTVIKFATVAGPTIWEVVKRLGPVISRLQKENPEVAEQITDQVRRLADARRAGKGPEGFRRRTGALRDQVAYLHASADDEGERARADAWRDHLDRIDASLPLIAVMGKKAAKAEREHLNTRIDELAAQILAAYIDEQDEDARPGLPSGS